MHDDLNTSADRVGLFSEAIDLCQQLNSVLARIGPARTIPDATYSVGEDKTTSELHDLESILQRKFSALIERRNAVLSTTSRLTDDLLRLIFQQGYDTLEERTQKATFARHVSHVSLRWRTLAIHTAPLWTHGMFSASRDLVVKSSHPCYPKMINKDPFNACLLDRAKGCLLNVLVKLPYRGSHEMLNEYFATSRDRVSHLDLIIEPTRSDSIQTALQCIERAQNILRTLHVEVKVEDYNNYFPVITQQMSESLLSIRLPRLHELKLTDMLLPPSGPRRWLALEHCRKLHLYLCNGSQYLAAPVTALLQSTPQLNELKLMYCGDDFGNLEISIPHIVVLTELSSFFCRVEDPRHDPPFSVHYRS
ncbi:hypothetical protein DACRYDRAFT_115254 [Dacryopinax primogenitus]|uniref:Uncharacterized protein n=1 Tax=Dacryopinax primogenitus (strain DJM 731) TaxID=1858805 RepID=M5FY15_DACPD|nr:uncharacterized protein DACRYDRAFT_115254 [Dacryopinax primogenitus]EJU02951.1 hypothetical protein DACRYDRAFT_115254 [Dacryopinax primogenitus]